jgi:uncharacterized protein YwgA
VISTELIERVRDVGVALYSSNTYNEILGRLKLQKLLYLTDTLAICKHLLCVKSGHETYYHGPYDQKIQNAVDLLGFWGLVRITDINVQEGKIASNYQITHEGEIWIEDLVTKSRSISQRLELTNAICDSLSQRNAFSKIKDLVYAEPTYSRLGQKGYGTNLELSNFDSNLSAQVVAKMESIYRSDKINLSIRYISDFLIEFLDQRSKSNYDQYEWNDE